MAMCIFDIEEKDPFGPGVGRPCLVLMTRSAGELAGTLCIEPTSTDWGERTPAELAPLAPTAACPFFERFFLGRQLVCHG